MAAPQEPHPSAPTTSGWAIASLVLGVLGFMLLSIPLSLIFGIIALGKTKDGGQRGRGLAIAGMVMSGLWVVLVIITVVVIAVIRESDDHGLVTGTTNSGLGLTVGQCIDAAELSAGSIDSVGCDQPHSGEVFAVLMLADFPSRESEEIGDRCRTELKAYAPSASPNVGVYVAYPGPSQWKYMDDHTAVCVATLDPERSGSIKG